MPLPWNGRLSAFDLIFIVNIGSPIINPHRRARFAIEFVFRTKPVGRHRRIRSFWISTLGHLCCISGLLSFVLHSRSSIIEHLMRVFHCQSSFICVALPVFYHWSPYMPVFHCDFYHWPFSVGLSLPVFYYMYCIAGLLSVASFIEHLMSLPVFYHLCCIAGLLSFVLHCRSSIICVALPVFYHLCCIPSLLSLVSIFPSSIAISIIEHLMRVFHCQSSIICVALPVFYHWSPYARLPLLFLSLNI